MYKQKLINKTTTKTLNLKRLRLGLFLKESSNDHPIAVIAFVFRVIMLLSNSLKLDQIAPDSASPPELKITSKKDAKIIAEYNRSIVFEIFLDLNIKTIKGIVIIAIPS